MKSECNTTIERLIQTLLKMFVMLVGAAIIGTFLLWVAYMLPTEPMVKNILLSEETLKAQDDAEYFANEEFWKIYDRGTNIIMLYEVIFPGSGNALQDALLAPTYEYRYGWWDDWAEVLMDYASNIGEEVETVTYARYWHGYLIFLKPLFMFLDLQGIYILNAIALIVSIIVVAYLFKKRLDKYWIVYLATVLMMHPYNIVQSFQLSTIFYALQITLLIMLGVKKWEKEHLLYVFLLDGILVAFFDFLTYPYVALGIPLLTCYLLNKEQKIKTNIITAIMNGVSFVIGYAGMWALKWIIASVLTNENVIMNAIQSVLHRTGVVEGDGDHYFMSISPGAALERNLVSFFNEQNLFILFVFLMILAIEVVRNRKNLHIDLSKIVICFLVAITPFVWIIILHNHASLHPHLEWRTFSVLIYAVGIGLISCISNTKGRIYG